MKRELFLSLLAAPPGDPATPPRSGLRRLFSSSRISQEAYRQMEDETTPLPKLAIGYSSSRKIIIIGLLIILVFFGIGGTWVTLAEITGAVITPGEVRIDTERKTVQHLEGGIIQSILVRNGDRVEAGQPLLVLDSSRIVAASDQMLLQMAIARLEEARLNAEINLAASVDWPAYDGSIPIDNYQDLLAAAEKVFNTGRQALRDSTGLLRKQIDQIKEQDRSIDGRLKAEGEIISALQEELDAKLVLFAEQYIDKVGILALRRSIAEHRGEQAALLGSQAELREKIAEFELRITNQENEYRQEAIRRQFEVQQRISDIQQQLLPLLDSRTRLTVTAPVAGEVVALQVHSVGGVIGSGQALMDIVPLDNPLIIECHVMVKDITHIHQGQHADIQLDAFKQRITPRISGQVVYISADRIMRPSPYGEVPTYTIHIELDRSELAANNLYVSAGMPVTAFITTEPRTVLDYIIEPLTASLSRALREN